MAQQINSFQIMEQQGWQGMTTPYNLGALWKKDPIKAYAFTTKVLAANNIPDRARELEKYPVLTVETPDAEFYWDLIGSSFRNIQLVEARQGSSVVSSSTTSVGIGGARFKLVFEENYFFNGELIVGEQNEFYLIRVIGDPVPEGMFWVYDVELMGSAFNSGMPGSELVKGKRFSSEKYSPATLIRSDIKGGLRGSSPFAMKQEMSFVRKDYSVAGIELSRKLNIAMPVFDKETNKQIAMTVPYKDWLFEMEFGQGIGNAILFGRSNRDANGYYHDKDTNGELITTGAGIREQMQVSNTYVYDVFKLHWLEDALYNMSAGKLSLGQRKFKMVTGEKGATQFHKAALDVASGWMASTGHQNFGGNGNINTMNSVQSPLHSNAFSMGFQIVQWRGPNGVIVDLEVDPTYDDPERFKIYKNNNPNDGVAESYRYDIYFEGIVDGEKNNLQLVKVKGQEQGIRGYVSGPFGNLWEDARVGNYHAATTKDEYSCHKIMSFGVIVRDPSRTLTLLPQELSHMQ